MRGSFWQGSSPNLLRNFTKVVLFARLFALSIHKLRLVVVLLQRLEQGSQSVHGTLTMAQGQRRSEHDAEAEQLQQGSSRTTGIVRCLLLWKIQGDWSITAKSTPTALFGCFEFGGGTALLISSSKQN